MLCICAALAAADLPADVSVTIATRQAALLVQDTPFAPALQLLNELQLGIGLRPGVGPIAGIRAGAGVGVGYVGASRMLGGYRYRGLVTRNLWISGGWSFASGLRLTGTGRAALASYELTSLVFSYAEIELAAGLTTIIGRAARIEWSIPFFYQFRHDVDYAAGVGLRGAFALEFSSPRP